MNFTRIRIKVRPSLILSEEMSGKELECSSNWLFLDETIEDVEHINLEPKMQRLLGCTVNEHVFLEHPFVYVPFELVTRNFDTYDSSFKKYKDKLKSYKDSTVLIGYASKELISVKFVICLTEKARDRMVNRNREVTKNILSYVRMKLIKTPLSWNTLGSEDDIDSTPLSNLRPYYEVEISLPIRPLRPQRELVDQADNDVRDRYFEIFFI